MSLAHALPLRSLSITLGLAFTAAALGGCYESTVVIGPGVDTGVVLARPDGGPSTGSGGAARDAALGARTDAGRR